MAIDVSGTWTNLKNASWTKDGLSKVPGSSYLIAANAGADKFISAATSGTAIEGGNVLLRNAHKGPLSWFGKLADKFNTWGVAGANKVGSVLTSETGVIGTKLAAYAGKPGVLGSAAAKLQAFGSKLTGITKLPGISTLITAGVAVWGVGKAAVRAFKGDFRGAGHQLLKSTGTVGGLIAGTALMATGVGLLPGLALALGAGFAGDWLGKKAADTVFGNYDEEQAAIEKGQQSNNNGYSSADISFAGGTDKEFNAQLADIMKGSRAF